MSDRFYLVTFSEIFHPYITLLANSEKTFIEYKPIPLSTRGLILKEDLELLLLKMLGHRDDLLEILSIEAQDFEAVTWSKSVDMVTHITIHLIDKNEYKSCLTFKGEILSVAKFEENLVPEALLTHEKPSIRDFVKRFRERYRG